jgi:type-F conjugative transfer system secretin TraK
MLRKFFILFSLIVLVKTSFAGQVISLINNGEGAAQIARTGLNRIYLEEDKIKNVISLNGELMIQKDIDNGQLFVKPIDESRDKPIEIFLTTESGNHFALSLKPLTIKSQNIGVTIQPNKSEDDNEETKILALIKQMGGVEIPKNKYTKKNRVKNKLKDKVKIEKKLTIKDRELEGEIYEIINNDKEKLKIDLTPYWNKDVKAVAVEKSQLSIGESSKIFVVKNYG